MDEKLTMAQIIDTIPADVLKQRIEDSRLSRPDVRRRIKKFRKSKEEKIAEAKREERKVLKGKFNSIKGFDKLNKG